MALIECVQLLLRNGEFIIIKYSCLDDSAAQYSLGTKRHSKINDGGKIP